MPAGPIVVSLPYGMSARNFLRSRSFDILAASAPIVVLTPFAADGGFAAEFARPGVTFRPYPSLPKVARALVSVIVDAETLAWARRHHIASFDIMGRTLAAGVADPTIRMHAGVFARRSEVLSRRPQVRRWLRERVLPRFVRRPAWEALVAGSGASLVFLTHPYTIEERALAIVAEAHGVRRVASIHSWDNITTKWTLLTRFQRVLVWNTIMQRDMVELYGYDPREVVVTGIPQLDFVVDDSAFLPRPVFFRERGLDPARRLITFACGSPDFVPGQTAVIETICRAIRDDRLAVPSQLMVRTHPGRTLAGVDTLRRYPHVHVDTPSVAYAAIAGRTGWDASRSDQRGFANLIRHADVFINCFSTTTIDAAAMDRPIVNIAYDGDETLPYLASCAKHYDFTHYAPIVASGGVALARDHASLLAAIDRYLQNPALDAAGRARIVHEQCYLLDGKAGERIADAALS